MLGIVERPESESLAWNLRAMEYAKGSDDPDARRWMGSLMNNIGWTYHRMGQYDAALEVFQEALLFRKEQGKPGPIRIARWCIAKMQRLLGQTEDALAVQESLCEECERAREPDGFVWEELGECLTALGRSKEAGRCFAQAYRLLSKDPGFPTEEQARLQRIKQLGDDA
jgi:tetratricopeptide (TPR) repeat protein